WQVTTNMVVVGLGSGALMGALPAAAAAAAPLGQTGVATGLTNTSKTVGGAFASAIFGVVLVSGTTSALGTAASFSGYVTVWVVCAGAALVAGVLLFFVPKLAFSDPVEVDPPTP
ncbi:MAG: MFS transporter, partial [Microbacteriaceae bacterium]